MEIVYRDLSTIKPNPKNPRKPKPNAIVELAESIKNNPDYFEARPILLSDRTGELVIVGGERRSEAARCLGLEKVPTILIPNLTEERENELMIIDNVHSGVWDEKMLESWDKNQLQKWGVELPKWDKPKKEVKEDDFDPDKKVKARCKFGELWQLGKHRLLCGDSTNKQDVEKLTGGGTIDLIFTDPPYNVAFNGRSGKFDVIKNDDLNTVEFDEFIKKTIEAIKKVNAKNIYIWCNWKFYGILQKQLDYNACIVWAKNVFGLGKGYRRQHEFCLFSGKLDEDVTNETDLWEIAKDTQYMHPTQKPIALCARALNNHKLAQNILDLFGGSGSTLMACEQLDRKCYMMEIDPHYCDVIIARWEKYTNLKAKKIK